MSQYYTGAEGRINHLAYASESTLISRGAVKPAIDIINFIHRKDFI